MSAWFEQLATSSGSRLEELLQEGQSPDLDALVGHEFRGANVGSLPRRLGLQKFIKGFFRGTGVTEGYNITVRQDGLKKPWVPAPSPEQPRRFGFYVVSPPGAARVSRDNRYAHAALIDYGASRRNPRWRIERALRDYIVVPDPDRPDVLLGKAYLALGPARIPVGYFVIERLRPSDWQP
jgi:hypothetical protein